MPTNAELIKALECGDLSVIQTYVNKGGNVNKEIDYFGSLLKQAVEIAHEEPQKMEEIIEYLILNGADLKNSRKLRRILLFGDKKLSIYDKKSLSGESGYSVSGKHKWLAMLFSPKDESGNYILNDDHIKFFCELRNNNPGLREKFFSFGSINELLYENRDLFNVLYRDLEKLETYIDNYAHLEKEDSFGFYRLRKHVSPEIIIKLLDNPDVFIKLLKDKFFLEWLIKNPQYFEMFVNIPFNLLFDQERSEFLRKQLIRDDGSFKCLLDNLDIFTILLNNQEVFYLLFINDFDGYSLIKHFMFNNKNLNLFKFLLKNKLNFVQNSLLKDSGKLNYLISLDNPVAKLKDARNFERNYEEYKEQEQKEREVCLDYKRKKKEIDEEKEKIEKTEKELEEKRRKIEAGLKEVVAAKGLEQLNCPICLESLPVAVLDYMPNLIITKCGHVFHRDCLIDALKVNNRCPSCREERPLEFDIERSE